MEITNQTVVCTQPFKWSHIQWELLRLIETTHVLRHCPNHNCEENLFRKIHQIIRNILEHGESTIAKALLFSDIKLVFETETFADVCSLIIFFFRKVHRPLWFDTVTPDASVINF